MDRHELGMRVGQANGTACHAWVRIEADLARSRRWMRVVALDYWERVFPTHAAAVLTQTIQDASPGRASALNHSFALGPPSLMAGVTARGAPLRLQHSRVMQYAAMSFPMWEPRRPFSGRVRYLQSKFAETTSCEPSLET
jgi:hypothetical protein